MLEILRKFFRFCDERERREFYLSILLGVAAALFSALERSGIAPKRLQLVQHSPTHPPKIVLVEGVRMGRPGLKVLPTLFVNEFNAQWRKEITHETAL